MRPSSPPLRRRRAARLALASALALAAAAAAPVRAGAEQEPAETEAGAPGAVVRSLRFPGAEAASKRALRALLATPAPPPWWTPWEEHPPFTPGTEEPDAERIVRHYRTLGYFETQVRPELRWRDGGRRVDVLFHVTEGEPVRLVARGIELPPELLATRDAEHFTEGLPLAEGDVFSLDRYEKAKTELLARVAEDGRPLASVSGGADVDVRTREARLTWRVEPGPVVRFGPVRVTGLVRAEEELVRRELALAEGDVYSLSALRETRAGIQALRVFRSVVVRPLPEEAVPGSDGEPIWPIEIHVGEGPPRSVRLGAGWGTDDHLRAQAGYQHRNWLGGARHLDARVRWSSLERSFLTAFEQPHWLARNQGLRLESRLGQELTPAYDAERLVASARVTRRFGERWSGSAGWAMSWSAVGDVGDEADRLLDDPERRVFLQGLRFDLRRSTVADPLDARDGSRVDLAVTPWLPALGSDVGFVAIEGNARIFRPLGPTVVAGRLRLGTLEPLPGSSADEVPLPERFYAGGGSSVRGFSHWRLGPRRTDGRPIGGASVLEASAELRFPIRGALGGVAFVDAGQVDLDPWGWKPADLTFSLGAGLRYGTPIGPLRFDLAHPLNAPDEAGTTWFHFSIGQAF